MEENIAQGPPWLPPNCIHIPATAIPVLNRWLGLSLRSLMITFGCALKVVSPLGLWFPTFKSSWTTESKIWLWTTCGSVASLISTLFGGPFPMDYQKEWTIHSYRWLFSGCGCRCSILSGGQWEIVCWVRLWKWTKTILFSWNLMDHFLGFHWPPLVHRP